MAWFNSSKKLLLCLVLSDFFIFLSCAELKSKEIINDQTVFEEKQYTDIWSNDEYLQFMFERIVLLKELLAPEGSIFLHCDWHKSHLLRSIMDEVFGANNFVNEIAWCYSRPSVASQMNYTRVHDTIFWYAKIKKNHKFFADNVRIEYSEATKNRNQYGAGGSKYAGGSEERQVNELGKIPEDYWYIPIPPGNAREILGYPTQKPMALLERIILGSTEDNDLVFDCFMGSGTTQAVAMKLGRRFLGADINLGAIQTTTKRLLKVAEELNQNTKQAKLDEDQPTYYTGFEVYNVNHYDVFRNPIQAKDLLIQALDIQPISNSIYDGEKDGRMVKLMPVNHIATKEDVADLINGVDYKTFEKRKADNPNQPVEKMQIVCMGHEPDLKAYIQQSIGYKLDIEIVDILRDRTDLQFKREAEAKISTKNNHLTIEKFYPMNLMQKLSVMEENITDWREMVESVMIDWNYDGAVFQPTLIDVPDKNELVSGSYDIPEDAGNIRVKITDLLSESLEQTISVEGE